MNYKFYLKSVGLCCGGNIKFQIKSPRIVKILMRQPVAVGGNENIFVNNVVAIPEIEKYLKRICKLHGGKFCFECMDIKIKEMK